MRGSINHKLSAACVDVLYFMGFNGPTQSSELRIVARAHANVSTTRLYDRRKSKPEENPTFLCEVLNFQRCCG
jgi:hypothetical protein